MSVSSFNPAKTAQSRVFLIEGGARGDHQPSYESCLRMTGVSQDFGDIEQIQNPDPNQYGSFIEIGEIRGEVGRATTSLQGRYALDLISALLKLAKRGCALDIHLHWGACQDPRDFDTFEKALVIESAHLTNFSTDDLGALTGGDNAAVNETADVSGRKMYEVGQIGYGVKAGSIITNELVDVTICDTPSCGDCEQESDGCYKIIGVTIAAGGSPSTQPDIVYSIDKGETWYAHDIDSLGIAENASAVACLGLYVVVVSNASNSLHYALKSEIDGVTDPTFTEVATGFVVTGEPNDIFSIGGKAFIVGDGGYIYKTDDPTAGVTVLEDGTATVSVLRRVHALSEKFAVAVGDDGAIVFTENGETWSLAETSPLGVGVGVSLRAVWVVSEDFWWVGTDTGRLFYTANGGKTWTEKTFPGSGSGVVKDIAFSSSNIGWLAHTTTAPRGRILRSYDGGYSWQVTPESGATLPANDRIARLAVCEYDVNFVVGVGLADDASDGFLVVGST